MTSVAVFPDVLVAVQKVPATTLPQFIAYVKANEGKMNCGSAGNGTTRHLACEPFNAQTGVKATHVPYRGTGPATAALLGGEIGRRSSAPSSAARSSSGARWCATRG